jgi:8-oxo-dGTP pyrophosphatase MutT (NUDIX family)
MGNSMSIVKEKSCGAVIFRRKKDIEVLVIRQNQGHWCFPKGHVEGDESEQETAKREVKEETGLKIRFLFGFREETSYSPKPGVTKDVIYFAAEEDGGRLKKQKSEVSEIVWVPLHEASALLTYENDRQLFMKAYRFYRDFEGREL